MELDILELASVKILVDAKICDLLEAVGKVRNRDDAEKLVQALEILKSLKAKIDKEMGYAE